MLPHSNTAPTGNQPRHPHQMIVADMCSELLSNEGTGREASLHKHTHCTRPRSHNHEARKAVHRPTKANAQGGVHMLGNHIGGGGGESSIMTYV